MCVMGYVNLYLLCVCAVLEWVVDIRSYVYITWFLMWSVSDPMYIPHGSLGGRYQILCIYHMVLWVVDIRSYVYTIWFSGW